MVNMRGFKRKMKDLELKSKLLSEIPGVAHGFGTLRQEIPLSFQARWESLRPKWKQVHGVSFSEIISSSQECGEIDAIFTVQPGHPIGIVTADCVPILFAKKDGKGVAAVHAGWRGTYAHITRHLWTHLIEKKGQKPSEWVAAIGPCIRECCYEVSFDLMENFKNEFPFYFPLTRNLDLVKLNETELQKIGIHEIEVLPQCTLCSKNEESNDFLFHSYRRAPSQGRQYSLIEMMI